MDEPFVIDRQAVVIDRVPEQAKGVFSGVVRPQPPAVIDPLQLKALCKLHCTAEEAAAYFEVSKATMSRYLRREPYKTIWERGRHNGKFALRRLQWAIANGKGNGAAAMALHLSKHWLGETDMALGAPSSNGGGGTVNILITAQDTKL